MRDEFKGAFYQLFNKRNPGVLPVAHQDKLIVAIRPMVYQVNNKCINAAAKIAFHKNQDSHLNNLSK